jgi:hypothetical protein
MAPDTPHARFPSARRRSPQGDGPAGVRGHPTASPVTAAGDGPTMVRSADGLAVVPDAGTTAGDPADDGPEPVVGSLGPRPTGQEAARWANSPGACPRAAAAAASSTSRRACRSAST